MRGEGMSEVAEQVGTAAASGVTAVLALHLTSVNSFIEI
jgi:hypothetical protein